MLVAMMIGFVVNAGVVTYLSDSELTDGCETRLIVRHVQTGTDALYRYCWPGRTRYVSFQIPDYPPPSNSSKEYIGLPSWVESFSTDEEFLLHSSGWPFECAWFEWRLPDSYGWIMKGGWWLESGWLLGIGDEKCIPYGPIWLGLTANTFFYAATAFPMLWLAGACRRRLRHRRRRRRNRCIHCNYDRTGLADPTQPCPECGHSPVGSAVRTACPDRASLRA